MNVFNKYRDDLVAIIEEMALPGGFEPARITVEPPRDPSHGDLATNAAMVLAKGASLRPRDLADRLVAELAALDGVAETGVAGPGFINLRLDDSVWRDCLRAIVTAETAYGDSQIGGGEKVNVEYVSANPTGPLHVAHARGAVYGDALAGLLQKAGYEVTREYYINDAGGQVDTLARSAYLRYREALGEDIGDIPEGLYPGDYLKDVGSALAARDGDRWMDEPESAWLPTIRRFAIDSMMDLIKRDLAALDVHQEVFSSERALAESGRVQEAFDLLDDRGLLYTGVLEPPKGKKPEDWEPRPQTLFRATQFGDDVDRPLKKSDGSWAYFATDIAYHLDKVRRGTPVMINVWGADHGGYVKRMKAAVKAITDGAGDLDIKICQMVRLLRGGREFKMSKRGGTFVTVREVVDEVGPGVVRFIMLTRKNDAPLEFDLEKVVEQSRDNPVYYVNYAHARAHSVLRHADEMFPGLDRSPSGLAGAALDRLDDPEEIALIKVLAQWPRLVEAAAIAHEPHRIAFYLHDLAAAFHGLWTKGKDRTELRFLVSDDINLTTARLALVQSVAIVIASGLKIFGVEAVEEMR